MIALQVVLVDTAVRPIVLVDVDDTANGLAADSRGGNGLEIERPAHGIVTLLFSLPTQAGNSPFVGVDAFVHCVDRCDADVLVRGGTRFHLPDPDDLVEIAGQRFHDPYQSIEVGRRGRSCVDPE